MVSDTTILDKVIKNVRVVRPNHEAVDPLDLGFKNGKFACVEPDIIPDRAKEVGGGLG